MDTPFGRTLKPDDFKPPFDQAVDRFIELMIDPYLVIWREFRPLVRKD